MVDIKLDVDNAAFITLTEKVCDEAAKKAIDKLVPESKAYLKRYTSKKGYTGKLASEIEIVPSKFKGGGWAIEAQGPDNYTRFYATFVELGSIRNPTPVPYLRNPLKANKQYIINLFKDLI